MRRLAAALAVVLLFVSHAFAQNGSATLTGFVQDSSKAFVPGARVTVIKTNTETPFVATTGKDGSYTISSLPVGPYRMEIEKPGFKTILKDDLFLHTQDTLQINFELAVGSTAESITVNGEATNVSPSVSMTVTRDFIANMPLNGRSLQDLIALAPGASPIGGFGLYSINGQRSDANSFSVDGASANLGGYNNHGYGNTSNGFSGSVPVQTALGTTQSLASVDALQEFTVQTSGFTAEYGRYPGGQVEFTTRSGTDSLHGSLFEYLRNEAFDANSWSNDHNNLPKGKERQNDFGGTLGGPLFVPHFYNGKGKTFYFVSYEGLRLLLPTSGTYGGVPSTAFRAWASPNVRPFLDGLPDPSQSPGYAPVSDGCTVPDPVTGTATPCDGTIPYSYSSKNNIDALNIRADHNVSSRWKLFVRYGDTPSSNIQSYYEVGVTSNGSHLWTGGLTGNLSNNVLSETRFNFTHESESIVSHMASFLGSKPWDRSLVAPSEYLTSPVSSLQAYVGPAGTSIRASTSYGGGQSLLRQYQLTQSISWNHGNHALKFGVDWRHLLAEWAQSPYQSTTLITSMADVQQGKASSLSVSIHPLSHPVFDNLSLYALDNWRIGEKLTLNYGLRWEFNPAPSVSSGLSPLAVDQVDNLATTQAAPWGASLYHTQYTKFAPRLGFSYRLIGSSAHPVVLRGGAGLYYDSGQQMAGAAFTNGYPFTASRAAQTEVPMPLSQDALAAPTVNLNPPYGAIYYFTDPNTTLPYTEQWNLSLDRTMSARNVMTLSYVGNVGRKILYSPKYPNTGNSLFNSSSQISRNGAQSSYNGLQIADNGYIGRNLQFVGSYSYAHALDNSSNDTSYYVLEYGNSSFDLRHILNAALNYQLALERGSILRSIGSGWLLAARFSAQTGTPLDIYQTTVTQPDGTFAEYRPDLVPGVPIYLHGAASNLNGEPVPGNWRLNRDAFACTTPTNADGSCSGTPTRQGTVGRNYVRTPGFYNLNLATERTFPIYESLHLRFRVEAFNILNHPNLAQPQVFTFSYAQFGVLGGAQTVGTPNQLYATGAARSLQLNLRAEF